MKPSNKNKKKEIYLDYNATTPVHPEVTQAVLALIGDDYGNPSTMHTIGRRAHKHVQTAREQTARLLGCVPEEIVFTSGGTESNNLALKGSFASNQTPDKRHIITTAVEHASVENPCRWLADHGCELTVLPVDRAGRVDPDQVEDAMRTDTLLVSVMHANNETGTIEPIEQISRLTRQRGIIFHVDGIQAAGKIAIDVKQLGCDLYSISGHKFGGLKGAGALYIRRETAIKGIQQGGGQETGRRAGTENVPGITALGKAAEVAIRDLEANRKQWLINRAIFEQLTRKIPLARVNGLPADRLPNTVNLCCLHADGISVLLALDAIGICVGTGSACTSTDQKPSRILRAMGLSELAAFCSIRISFGPDVTGRQAEQVANKIAETVERIRLVTAPEDIGVCDENCPCFF